jgi:multiple sugar transport system substrate-binding protein
LALAGLAGCKPERPRADAPPRPFAGALVRVACPGDPAAAVVAEYGRGWALREGARVEVAAYDPQAGPAAGPAADVWVVAPAELPRLAAAGQLRRVPDDLTARGAPYDWPGLLPLFADKLLTWDGAPYALPLLGESPVCAYRADLLGAGRHRDAFRAKYGRPLGPPAAWEEFADVAEYFRDQKGEGLDGPSLPPLPAGDGGLEREFFAAAAPFARRAVRLDEQRPPTEDETFSFHFDLKTLGPRLEAPGFVYALQLLQRLQKCRPAAAGAEPAQAFLDGRAVLCLADAPWVARFQQAPRLKGKVGVCRLPGSRSYFDYHTGRRQEVNGVNHVPYLGAGGWLAAVPVGAERPEAAFALLAELSGPKTSLQIVSDPTWGGGAFRYEHFNSASVWYGFDLDREQTAGLVEGLRQTLEHPGLKNPVLRLRTPDQRDYRQALLAEVRRALEQGGDAGQALAAAAARWRELGRRKDEKTRRAEYLISLSLQPEG